MWLVEILVLVLVAAMSGMRMPTAAGLRGTGDVAGSVEGRPRLRCWTMTTRMTRMRRRIREGRLAEVDVVSVFDRERKSCNGTDCQRLDVDQ